MTQSPSDAASGSPKIVVLVLTYGGADYAVECCRSLMASTGTNYRLVFIDNASPDGTYQALRAFAQNDGLDMREVLPGADGQDFDDMALLTLMQSGDNLGYAGGNNVALRWLQRGRGWDFVWILNPDTFVEPDAMACLAKRAEQRPKAGIIGARICYDPDRHIIQNYGGGRIRRFLGVGKYIGLGEKRDARVDEDAIEKQLEFIVGASLFVRRSFLETVGLMEERYFLYNEELDWCLRRGAYELAYAHEAIVYHRLGASIGSSTNRGGISSFSMFWNIRNRFRFVRKFFPYYLPTVYLGCWYEINLMARAGAWRNVWVILLTMHGLKSKP